MPILVILIAGLLIGEFVTGGMAITTVVGAAAGAAAGAGKSIGRSAMRAHLKVKEKAAKHWYTKAGYSFLSATVATASEVLWGAAKGVVPGVRVAHRKRRALRSAVIAKGRKTVAAKRSGKAATGPATDPATAGATDGAADPAGPEGTGDSDQVATEDETADEETEAGDPVAAATDATEAATGPAAEAATDPATGAATDATEAATAGATDGPAGTATDPATGILGDNTTDATEAATAGAQDTLETDTTDDGENAMNDNLGNTAIDKLASGIVAAEDTGLAGMMAGWDAIDNAFSEFWSPIAEFIASMAAFAEANEENDGTYTDVVEAFQEFSENVGELEDMLSTHVATLHESYDPTIEALELVAKDSQNSATLLGEQ
jgi:hypothetical protein